MSFSVFFQDSIESQELLADLEATYPDIVWEHSHDLQSCDLAFLTDQSLTPKLWHGQVYVVKNIDGSEFDIMTGFVSAVTSGDVILPSIISAQLLHAKIQEEESAFRKVRNNNPMFLTGDLLPDENQFEKTLDVEVYPIHETALQRFVPKLAKILRSRSINSLQRIRDNWVPLQPICDDPIVLEYYNRAKVPSSAMELREKVSMVTKDLEKINLKPSVSRMDRTQLDLGVFFPGQFNRDVQGLTGPTDQFDWCCEVISKIMLRGLAQEVADRGIDDVKTDNVRVGVKVSNFQGSILSTTAHSVRLGMWEIMKQNGNDIFFFRDYYSPAISGFRLQDNASGKLRTSHIISQAGKIARTKVADGETLNGKSILHYDGPSDRNPSPIIDSGDSGARARIIFNLWSGKNDATLPVPAYIANYKDGHYKAVFQQSKEIFNRFIPGTLEFREFWLDGWETSSWVKKYAAQRGFTDFESFHDEMLNLGEYVAAGDVENFDGNLVWNIAKLVFKHLLSPETMYVMERMWNEDKIGCYVDRKGNIIFYLVKANVHECSHDELEAVQKTAEAMSSFASGYGTTAQGGRICVPAVLIDIVLQEFLSDCPELKELISTMPESRKSRFSFISALMNSAGDDHILGSLVIWLVTGIHPKMVRERIWARFEKYTIMTITREDPPMNAGFYFHENDEGQLINVSLSDKRMFANTVYPERQRSAIGLLASTDQYVESAIGTPFEEKMLEARNIIVTKIYGFEDIEHLRWTAEAETAWLAENEDSLSPAELLSIQLGIPQNDLEWKYTYDELLEMGADVDALSSFRRPIPSELTVNPFRFLNESTVLSIVPTLPTV